MAKRLVEFFYDVKCPYAWFGFETLCRYRGSWNIDLQFRPMFLGGLRKESGNQQDVSSPAKTLYALKDIERMAKHFQVPVRIPKDREAIFSRTTLEAMRALGTVSVTHADLLEEASRQLWKAFWTRHDDLADDRVLVAALRTAGLDTAAAADVVATSKTQEAKERLRATTQQALDHGGFGAPTIVIHGGDSVEMVFGSDRMFLVADFLGQKYEGTLTHLAKL